MCTYVNVNDESSGLNTTRLRGYGDWKQNEISSMKNKWVKETGEKMYVHTARCRYLDFMKKIVFFIFHLPAQY